MTAVDPATRDLALLGETAPRDPIALRNGRHIARAAMLADAQRLAATLPAGGVALNYCTDRYRFLCALVATLLRGQLTLLPQDRSAGTIDKLAAGHAGLYVLCDGAERPARVPSVEVACDGAVGESESEPILPATQKAVTLFTSGSTGEPTPHTRDWRWLVAGARHYHDAFGLARQPFAHIVGTVPPQHSYGLESTILLPLLRRTVIVARTPFFTGDIERALTDAPAPRLLVTAPIHIQALVHARARLPALALILSATAPLSTALAGEAERLFSTEVREVYGCSEIGLVATRRTVDGNRWLLPPDMTAAIDGEFASIAAPHLPQPVPLGDVLERIDDRHVALAGRRADMVNIAGKRASLAGLNAILAATPGVQDGVFFVPDADAAGTVRLAVLVVAPGQATEAIRRALRARMDPAFVPRTIHRVDALPRDENGKLPHAALADLARRLRLRGNR
ncbi:MAG: AMP-binding protein [Alphaproteobacteria bacterium]